MSPTFTETFKSTLLEVLTPLLSEKFSSLTPKQIHASLELTSGDPKHGDLSTALPLKLAKPTQTNPLTVGDYIATVLTSEPHKSRLAHLEEIVCTKPGFLNFKLNSPEKSKQLIQIITGELTTTPNPQYPKILLEYISANPTGPLHIGHGRWAAYGSTLASILRFSGHTVREEFYVNDVGNQIENLHASVTAIRNHQPIPESGYHGDYLQVFKNNTDDPLETFLKDHQTILHELRVTFGNDQNPSLAKNHFYRESHLRTKDKLAKMLDFLKQTGLSYQADGATWFASKRQGNDDKDRVIVKSDGSYTYFFMDILYHFTKMERGYPHLIDILGADHHGYTKRISTACHLLYDKIVAPKAQQDPGPNPSNQPPKLWMDVVIGQLVNLYQDGKPMRMSKRAGTIIELRTVLDEIGVDALRYFLLQQNVATTLEFDLTKAKEQSMDNPVFYVQYAHARICSIFTKAETLSLWSKEQTHAASTGKALECYKDFDYSLITSPTVHKLFHKLLRFKDEVNLISKSYEVHHLPRYLHELATLFHKLYNETPFLASGAEAERTRSSCYLILLLAVDKILVTGLDLMGISHPDTM